MTDAPSAVDALNATMKVAAGSDLAGRDLVALLMHGPLGLAENEARAFVRGGYEAYRRTAIANRSPADAA